MTPMFECNLPPYLVHDLEAEPNDLALA